MKNLEEAKAAEERFAEAIARFGLPRRQRERVSREALVFGLEAWSDGFDAGVETCLASLREWSNLPGLPEHVLEGLRICIQNLSRAHVATAGRAGVEKIVREIDERLS